MRGCSSPHYAAPARRVPVPRPTASYVSLKAAQGFGAREVSAWMGHGSVSFTLHT